MIHTVQKTGIIPNGDGLFLNHRCDREFAYLWSASLYAESGDHACVFDKDDGSVGFIDRTNLGLVLGVGGE